MKTIEYKRFGDFCRLIKGKRPILSCLMSDGLMPYLTARYMRGSDVPEYASIRDKNSIIVNDSDIIIICDGSNSGETFCGFKGILSSTMAIVKHDRKIDAKYLRYFLTTVFDKYNSAKTGSAIPHLDQAALRDELIPLLPIEEQQRIVAILDEAFDAIATAKANTEQNLQNSHSLFESYHQSSFQQSGDRWQCKTMDKLVTFRNGINFTKSSKGETIDVIGVSNFKNDFWAPTEDLDSVTIDGKLANLDKLKENDILFVRSNGNIELIGRCILVGAISKDITHSGFTIRARLDDHEIMPKYLCHFLKTKHTRRLMIDSGIGTNIKSLSQSALSALEISYPPTQEQSRIVDKLENLKVQLEILEVAFQDKICLLESLKKSLLHQAFNGQLTAKATDRIFAEAAL